MRGAIPYSCGDALTGAKPGQMLRLAPKSANSRSIECQESRVLFRILYLIALIGAIGPDTRPVSSVEPVEPDEERRMGGEGFGNIVSLVALIGVAVLAAIVILAVLALAGQFENQVVDPPV